MEKLNFDRLLFPVVQNDVMTKTNHKNIAIAIFLKSEDVTEIWTLRCRDVARAAFGLKRSPRTNLRLAK